MRPDCAVASTLESAPLREDPGFSLRCKNCFEHYPPLALHSCDKCFGPLEVVFDYDRVSGRISKESIAAGPQSLWRYEALLPKFGGAKVDLGAGCTRLREAPRLAAELGVRRIWLKEDAANPTHSFKDRVTSVALSAARHFGFEVAACASTGNLANAVAAHAAASGMASVVLIPAGLERGKVAATQIYGGTVVEVDGSYDDVNRICAELASERQWALVNVNLRPYYAEGSKTLAFEIAEQLGWKAPPVVVCPMASGALLTKIAKGLRELFQVGLLDEAPSTKLFGAQAEGCAPIVTAFEEGTNDVQPVKPNTIAKSLAIGNPADGPYAVDEVRSSRGSMTAVAEEEVSAGIRLLAKTEGIFTETAGGVTISAVERLVRSGALSIDEEIVVLLTGTGLKTLEAVGGGEPTLKVSRHFDEVSQHLERIGL